MTNFGVFYGIYGKTSLQSRKIFNENIDLAQNLSYNRRMRKNKWQRSYNTMYETRLVEGVHRKKIIFLRILLTLACLGFLAWIFSNSLQSGAESSLQSNKVMKIVQSVAAFVAPNSYIATATGEDYELIHAVVRTLAHFSEFAVLGVLVGCCYCSYTNKKLFVFLPFSFLVCVPLIDEFLQTLTEGRAAEISDILVDMAGACTGLILSLCVIWLIQRLYRKALNRKIKTAKLW